MQNASNKEKVEITFARENDTVIIPSKRDEDGGFDIYANFKEDYMVIPPHEVVMIPTGLASAFSPDYRIVLKERGSTGSKGMAVRAGIIDSGFRGYWFVAINNTTNRPIVISKDEHPDLAKIYDTIYPCTYDSVIYPFSKIACQALVIYPYSKAICQALIEENPKTIVTTTSYEKLKEINSERGTSQLGQSGK